MKENRSVLDNMARVLVEKETIYNEEVLMLVKGADYKEVIAYMEEREGKPRENVFSVAVNPAKEAEKQTQEKSEEVVEATEQSTAAEAPEETKEDKE